MIIKSAAQIHFAQITSIKITLVNVTSFKSIIQIKIQKIVIPIFCF